MLSRPRILVRFSLFAAVALAALTAAVPAAASASTQATPVTTAGAGLTPQNGSSAFGLATLMWSPATHDLVVTVSVSGLVPGSKHPDHIHQGSCVPGNGAVVYGLTTLVAGHDGVATAVTVIPHVRSVHFAGGWYVNVHQGPTLNGAGFTPIACGDVSPVVASANLTALNGSGASGHAMLSWNPEADTLLVGVTMQGLVPGSTHPDHIHAGSCVPGNGAIVYPLNDLTAVAGGHASAVTVVHGVTSVSFDGGWYINVHQGPTLVDGGATPIACGNVRPA